MAWILSGVSSVMLETSHHCQNQATLALSSPCPRTLVASMPISQISRFREALALVASRRHPANLILAINPTIRIRDKGKVSILLMGKVMGDNSSRHRKTLPMVTLAMVLAMDRSSLIMVI